MPSFGTDAARLSHAKGPVIFLDCVCGVEIGVVLVLGGVAPHGTPGKEAEKLVKREGSGGGLAAYLSVSSLACPVGAFNVSMARASAESCWPSTIFSLFTEPVDIRCVVRRGDLVALS